MHRATAADASPDGGSGAPCVPVGLLREVQLPANGGAMRLQIDGGVLTATYEEYELGATWRATRFDEDLRVLDDREIGDRDPRRMNDSNLAGMAIAGDLVAWVYEEWDYETLIPDDHPNFVIETWDGEVLREAPLAVDLTPRWIVPRGHGWWVRATDPSWEPPDLESRFLDPYYAVVIDEGGRLLREPEIPCNLYPTSDTWFEGPDEIGIVSLPEGRVCAGRPGEDCTCWSVAMDVINRIPAPGGQRDLAWTPDALVLASGADELWFLPWDGSEPRHVTRSTPVGHSAMVRLHWDGEGLLRSYVPYSMENCFCTPFDPLYEGCHATAAQCGQLLVERVGPDGGAVGEPVLLGYLNVPTPTFGTRRRAYHAWATSDAGTYLLWMRLPHEADPTDPFVLTHDAQVAVARLDCAP